jgi:hypothetical protein
MPIYIDQYTSKRFRGWALVPIQRTTDREFFVKRLDWVKPTPSHERLYPKFSQEQYCQCDSETATQLFNAISQCMCVWISDKRMWEYSGFFGNVENRVVIDLYTLTAFLAEQKGRKKSKIDEFSRLPGFLIAALLPRVEKQPWVEPRGIPAKRAYQQTGFNRENI